MSRVVHLDAATEIRLGDRCCILRLAEPHESLGLAVLGGGLATTRTVSIHAIRNAELGVDVDPLELARRLEHERVGESGVVLLTSRTLAEVDVATASDGGCEALALATVGLGNALRVGDSSGPIELPGTINVVVRVDVPLTLQARLEALTLIAEARTAAMVEAGVRSMRSGGLATGTGTDAIVLLSPRGAACAEYAGKHTPVGAALGAAALAAVRRGIERWRREVEPTLPERGRSGVA